MKSNIKGSIFLLLCAFIWGMAFVAQSTATDYVGTFTFVFARSLLTSVVLFIAFRLFTKKEESARIQAMKKTYLLRGALIGAILFSACSFQQAGIAYTTTAKSGFVTALYIVMIPIIGVLFMKKRIGRLVWAGVAVALTGMCLLCLKDDLSVNFGDLLTLVCAVLFSFHVIAVDELCGELNSVLISAIQFATCSLLALPLMLLAEKPELGSILACWTSIAYAGVFSGAIAYTLQIVGQKYAEPTLASLLMCLESVFAALGGWVLLGQVLSVREFIGCALMLSASVIAQLPDRRPSH